MSGGGVTEVFVRGLESHFIEEQPNYQPFLASFMYFFTPLRVHLVSGEWTHGATPARY